MIRNTNCTRNQAVNRLWYTESKDVNQYDSAGSSGRDERDDVWFGLVFHSDLFVVERE